MASVARAHVDLSNRAKSDFQVDQVLYRLTPGALNPVARYLVTDILKQDTYRVQAFDEEGMLINRPIVVTAQRVGEYHLDPVATRMYERLMAYGAMNEESL